MEKRPNTWQGILDKVKDILHGSNFDHTDYYGESLQYMLSMARLDYSHIGKLEEKVTSLECEMKRLRGVEFPDQSNIDKEILKLEYGVGAATREVFDVEMDQRDSIDNDKTIESLRDLIESQTYYIDKLKSKISLLDADYIAKLKAKLLLLEKDL